jgi:hypothetical protein
MPPPNTRQDDDVRISAVAFEERRHVVGALADDQQHLVDAGEVHRRRELA